MPAAANARAFQLSKKNPRSSPNTRGAIMSTSGRTVGVIFIRSTPGRPKESPPPRGEANTRPKAAGQPEAGPAKRDAVLPHRARFGGSCHVRLAQHGEQIFAVGVPGHCLAELLELRR